MPIQNAETQALFLSPIRAAFQKIPEKLFESKFKISFLKK